MTHADVLEFDRRARDLAGHYRQFQVSERLLLTGHSHQAWPDVGLAAQQQAWLDAAMHVDDKWSYAFEQAERVKLGRTVAIKFLHVWGAANHKTRQRFDLEARAMARLDHPNCATVIGLPARSWSPRMPFESK